MGVGKSCMSRVGGGGEQKVSQKQPAKVSQKQPAKVYLEATCKSVSNVLRKNNKIFTPWGWGTTKYAPKWGAKWDAKEGTFVFYSLF